MPVKKSTHRPTQNAMDQLIALFNQGRYAELEGHAQSLLNRYPESGFAWKILGTALGIQGKSAVPALQKAAQFLPNDAETHYNLGLALQTLGQFDAAIASYRRALVLRPDDADAHSDLGNALQELGRHEAAVASYRRALALNPRLAEAHNKLGCALHDLGNPRDAAASYRRALALNPRDVEAYNNLGFALQEVGQLEDALTHYRQALALDPVYAVAHNNLGNVLQELGQLNSAVASFQRALELKPEYVVAHYNLGNALQELGQIDAALTSYQRALVLDPDSPKAHNNLGNVLKDLGQLDAALASYKRALAINREYAEVRGNLLFILNFTASHTTDICLEEARTYGRMVAKQVAARFTQWQCTAKPERLRVGLVSGDLRIHPVGHAIESLLEQIDPTQLELIAYPTSRKVDELTARIRPYFSYWKPIYGKNDADAAHLIHSDGVHILLDLSGHTAHNRLPLFAWKPAPLQASWLGYFATTGVAEISYLLTSEVAVPQTQHADFTENVWYLPDIWLCFTPPKLELPVTTLPALQNGFLTLGCFQRMDKISDAALGAWGRILTRLPKSRLRLACKQLGDAAVASRLMQRLQLNGINPTQVELQGAAGTREEYLARYAEVDIMLDTFPYPGVTTTCEALWMGVPTLTLAGNTLLSRQGAGILIPAGLRDWVATNEIEYVEKALQLTSNFTKLAELRAGLRAQVLASPVFDAPRFARNFEAALWALWRGQSGLEIAKNEPM